MVFFDANIILYTDDSRVPDKQKVASELIARHIRKRDAVISFQVLQEYYFGATRKFKVAPEEAQEKVSSLLESCRMVTLADEALIAGIELHRLHTISFWDAFVIQAARTAGVQILYSEDLQRGRMFGSTRIVDPFSISG